MRKVVLELLGSLEVHKHVCCLCKSIKLSGIEAIGPITQIVRRILNVKPHVPTNSTAFIVLFHVSPHFVDSVVLWLEAYVKKNTELGVYGLAEAFEEEQMRR